MTLAIDLERRQSKPTWFDGETIDTDGTPVRMYSVVTPIKTVTQHFAFGEEPIVLMTGRRLVVTGSADGDLNLLWLDVDDPGPFANANICLATHEVRYLCMVGDDVHIKGRL